jgi:hypothetical protein
MPNMIKHMTKNLFFEKNSLFRALTTINTSWIQGERYTLLRWRGWGGPNSNEGTDTLVFYLMYAVL